MTNDLNVATRDSASCKNRIQAMSSGLQATTETCLHMDLSSVTLRLMDMGFCGLLWTSCGAFGPTLLIDMVEEPLEMPKCPIV